MFLSPSPAVRGRHRRSPRKRRSGDTPGDRRFAHVIFASSDAQRDFWLGRKALNEDELRSRYNGLKPCLRDAHKADDVGAPFGNRFSWIKTGLSLTRCQAH